MADPRFEGEFKKRIGEEIDRIRDILEAGTSVTDLSQYKFLIGQIFAYKRVINDYFDEVTDTLNRKE